MQQTDSYKEVLGAGYSYENALLMALVTGVPDLVMTDGYKFSMAQAGFPLREETFYMSFRRRGAYYVPFDVEQVIRGLIPKYRPGDIRAEAVKRGLNGFYRANANILQRSGYEWTTGMLAAYEKSANPKAIKIHAAPKGSWIREKEPLFTITGPSFIVSYLEPLALMLHFPIQVATEALVNQRVDYSCTTMDEFHIVKETLLEIDMFMGSNLTLEGIRYRADVAHRAQELIDALEDKNPDRLFEVGMRACSCMSMHQAALTEILKLGIIRTSNVWLAEKMNMLAVGTTGHEHIQRWGDDLTAFRAMRDMRPGIPSYLPDTFDVMKKGLPAAFRAIREQPDRPACIRFDSGDQDEQLRLCMDAVHNGLPMPTFIFEDSINPDKIKHFEALSREMGIPPAKRLYGAGQYFVKPEFNNLTRDRVSAIYKLCQTGEVPVMKTCASAPTKVSLPGKPVIFRPIPGYEFLVAGQEYRDAAGVIGQEGEEPPAGFEPLSPNHQVDMTKEIDFSHKTRGLRYSFEKRLSLE